MISMLKAYSQYPFRVSLRVKFFNMFRILFTLPPLERFLVRRLVANPQSRWKKCVPPLYFYESGSERRARRADVNYVLDISRMHDHSLYFCSVGDPAWETLFSLLRDDYTVLDAGANIGYLTLHFAKTCRRVYSFEPDSKTFSDLARNVAENPFTNITLFQKALGETAGNYTLYKLYINNPGANRILTTPPESLAASEKVEVTTLDTLFEQGQFEKIDLMKVDVEGFELFLMRGATKLIKTWRPILFMELAEVNLNAQGCTARSLVSFVEGLGYEIKDAKNLRAMDKDNLVYTDVVCFPMEKRTE